MGKKVFVGLSGGVDSAVSAALLQDQGFEVTGVFIKVWSPDFLPCTWRDERRDAMRVAATLDIPFLFFDFEESYKRGVAETMIEEYRLGRTPNPDILCNREVKFGSFWQKAREMGADYIATGHYARVQETEDKKYELREGKDIEKDQSYFLWTLTQDDLAHTQFPVGGFTKKEVRKLAEKYKLPVSEKKDSQGICFLGDVDIEEFLSHFIEMKAGDVYDIRGNKIGRHNGAILYTIGERHGFDVLSKEANSRPYYVVSKDIRANTITVSNDPAEIKSRATKEVRLENLNWISKPVTSSENPEARIRYRQERFGVKAEGDKVIFNVPQTVAAGQSVVFYSGDVCLGGGTIEKTA
jgi:tRNA-uridine 2-sulfurtransferase